MSAKLLVGVCLMAAMLMGCAATNRYVWKEAPSPQIDKALNSILNRWQQWNSMAASVKLRFSVGDTTLVARGHIFYMNGERYEVGFAEPYNRVLGNLYVTPTQIVYWSPTGKPQVYGPADTIRLSKLLMMNVPNWNPRDLLPLPISARTSGFQTDSLWIDDAHLSLLGRSDEARYDVSILNPLGAVSEERIERTGYDPVNKHYGKMHTLHGWQIARRIICEDTSGTVSLTWYLSGIVTDIAPRIPILPDSSSSETGTLP